MWLLNSVTIAGHRPGGLGVSGMGASVVDDEDKVLMSTADLVQNEVAEPSARSRVQRSQASSGGRARISIS